MISIAWKNLVHERSRLAASLVGVAFAVILMLMQSGIYFGFLNSASAIIDHCPADLWIVSANAVNFESSATFSERELSAVRGTPGVAWAERLIHLFGYVTLPDGRGTWAQIVGFNPESRVGGPWEMIRGAAGDVKKPGSYIIDRSSMAQLSGIRVGDKLENNSRMMEIVGVCRGAKTNTTYPIFFTSYETAQKAIPGGEERTSFIVARLEVGAARNAVLSRLKRSDKFDIYTREGFSGKTRDYWATKTGIGVGIGVTILLGFVVGLVVVGQTMYASTVERLREYATLKALGASNATVCSMIGLQAVLMGIVGYAVGALLTLLAGTLYVDEIVAMALSPMLFGVMFGLTLAMCLGASLLSIVRVLRVSPAEVFRS